MELTSPLFSLAICNHSGTLSYIYAFLKGIVGAKKCRGTIVLDGEERIEFNHILFLSVHNHPYEGHYAFGKAAFHSLYQIFNNIG